MIDQRDKYYKEIHDYITSFYPMSNASFNQMLDASDCRELKAGDILVDSGDVPSKIYMLNKGVMRSFVRLESGKEVTKSLFLPIIIFASFDALLNQSPSSSIYEALTDCDICVLEYFEFKSLCNSNTEILGFYAKFLETLICEKDKKHIELLTMGGKARYLNLRKMIPNIDNLIPQYQIAKYLSITPVQLSRIRAKL
ncbi:Crp/Fnr family transcriptional regulator [Olleya namhaensis]|uniref:Crp/Fnr family transcriptional regulator n=1 Tax=Olleya namhaensis TaxID=1144750 RepID=UPI002490E93D|nr:Crp/Fnr family transcriptional regulator [Olleya namhaensis]